MKITKEKIYFHTPYRMLLDNLAKISEMCINCEIYIDGKALDSYTASEVERINSTFTKEGMLKIAHGPFLGLNPGSRDPKIQDITYERFVAAFEFCRKIEANHIVLHSGFEPAYYINAEKLFLELSIPQWKRILKAAVENNVVIALENSIDPDPEIVVTLLKEMNSPNFEACFDAAHYNVFNKNPLLELYDEYPLNSIGELHLSDNKGDFDAHLALGEGNIDFRALFGHVEKRGREPIFTSESHSMKDIEKNLKYLLSLNI